MVSSLERCWTEEPRGQAQDFADRVAEDFKRLEKYIDTRIDELRGRRR